MTQTMDLNKMGLMPMEVSELQQVEGGRFGLWDYVVGKVVDVLVDTVIAAIKAGKANNIGPGGSAGVPGGGGGFMF